MLFVYVGVFLRRRLRFLRDGWLFYFDNSLNYLLTKYALIPCLHYFESPVKLLYYHLASTYLYFLTLIRKERYYNRSCLNKQRHPITLVQREERGYSWFRLYSVFVLDMVPDVSIVRNLLKLLKINLVSGVVLPIHINVSWRNLIPGINNAV